MNGFLADTNVPSELTRPVPESGVLDFLAKIGKDSVYLSVLSLGEIRAGIAGLPPGRRRRLLEDWLQNSLKPWFGERVLPVTEAIVDRWGILTAEAKHRGAALGVVDGLIAATALEHDLAVLTRNVRDFSGTGVTVINPWEDAPPKIGVSKQAPKK